MRPFSLFPTNNDHIGKPLSTAEAAASVPATLYQTIRITTGYKNQLLRTALAGLFFYGNPSFTKVQLELWADRGGSPSRKLATSDSYVPAECNTDTFSYRTMAFTFAVALKKNTFYHVALRPTGYTGDASSHIAWRQAWPDPPYPAGITDTLEFGAKFPFDLFLETADL